MTAAAELPPEVSPQPLPCAVGIAVTDSDPRWVVLQISDAAGVRVVFLEPAAAESIGGKIRAAGRQAQRPSFVVPGGGLIVPGR